MMACYLAIGVGWLDSAEVANDHKNPAPPPPVVGNPAAVLESHERALSGLRAGVVDLEGSPSYLMLTSESLGSITGAKVGSAAAEAHELWPLLNAVGAALVHIRDEADSSGNRSSPEIRRLLGEPWIDTPVAILARASVQEILNDIRRRYDAIRPFVSDVEGLWQTILPRIDAANTTLARLGAEVERLGVREPLISRAEALSADLATRLVDDPLAVTAADGDQLDAQVAEAAEKVVELLSSHASLDDDLAGTEQLLASLRLLRATAAAAGDRTRLKVAEAEGLVRVPSAAVIDGPGGVADRLDQLLSSERASAWNQRRALLDGWLVTARKLEQQLQRAHAANQAPLDQRDELRGRLRAYQAKISAVGRAEDLELTDLVDEIRAQLYTAPTDLKRAAATIDQLARSLRS